MNGEIYIIKNKINNKVYIGQTIQGSSIRFKQHLKLSKANKNQLIYKAIKKYGKEKFYFEVLENNIQTYKKLSEAEELYITKFNSITPNGYNMCPGGQKYRRKSDITNEQISIITNMYNNGNSTRAIGEQFNLSHCTINKVLRDNNIDIRNRDCNLPDRSNMISKDVLIDLYINKKITKTEIESMVGTSRMSILRALRKYKII